MNDNIIETIKKTQVIVDKNGFVIEQMMPGGTAILQGGIEVEDDSNLDLEDFVENYKAYQLFNGRLIKDDWQAQIVKEENEKEELRMKREKEVFPIINRGILWYNTLTEEQNQELWDWYNKWLNVTETKEIPQKPKWLK